MSNDKSICVYGLLDPYIGQFFYVGLTYNPKTRLSSHISYAKSYAKYGKQLFPVMRYIMKMLRQDRKPIFVIIEKLETGRGYMNEPYHRGSEQFWIRHLLNCGHPLTNVKEKTFTDSEYATELARRNLAVGQVQS